MLYPDFKCCCEYTNVDNFGGGGDVATTAILKEKQGALHISTSKILYIPLNFGSWFLSLNSSTPLSWSRYSS